ncbi:hypothetical protein ABH945_006685 [Paraburkholderia sp. GAS333]
MPSWRKRLDRPFAPRFDDMRPCIVPERCARSHPRKEIACRINSGRRDSPLVCGLRAFYGLMTFDETGVLRPLAAWFSRRGGEAERDPLHPIRVIPAREVSGSYQSSIPRRAASVHSVRACCPAGFTRRFRPGYVRFLPYGKDSMTANSSDMCFALRRVAADAPCFSVAFGNRTERAR